MITPIAHRINSIEAANSIPSSIGIEFDVRAYGSDLIVSHDPFIKGVKLKTFLEKNTDRLCAINIKEEGIERDVIEISKNLGVKNFFLFDVNFPQVFKLANEYKKHLCLRISEFEKPLLSEVTELCTYLWIDTFGGNFWINKEQIKYLKNLQFNLCFVSPELHRPIVKKQIEFAKNFKNNIELFDEKDTICTKDYKIYSEYW